MDRNRRLAVAALLALLTGIIAGSARAQSPGVTSLASVAADGSASNASSNVTAISADGRYVAFGSWADDLVPGDTQGVADVFVRDRLAQTTERVSVDSTGLEGNGASGEPDLSADGRFVAFTSEASNLVEGDGNGVSDVFVHDRVTHTTERVSVALGGGDPDAISLNPAISADGRWVGFESQATNLTADPNPSISVYLYDRDNDVTTQIAALAWDPDVSANGCVVAFTSSNGNLLDPPVFSSRERVFVRDCGTGAISLVSRGSGAASLSADGRVVAYQSTEGVRNVLVYDRDTGVTKIASQGRHTSECGSSCPYGDSYGPRISADGRFVAFASKSGRLLPAPFPIGPQVYVYDRATHLLRRISVDSSGQGGSRCSDGIAISGDGAVVAYGSTSDEIVPGDENGHRDILVSEWTCPPPSPGEEVDPLPQGCTPRFACPRAPATCTEATASKLRIRRRPIGSDQAADDDLYWLWRGPLELDEVGDPRQAPGYQLCIYSPEYYSYPSTSTVDHDTPIDGGASWRRTAHGYRLAGAGPGIDEVQLRAGANGRIVARGNGTDLTLPYLPLATDDLGPGFEGPVSVRLHRRDGPECWGADFPADSIRENSAGRHRENGHDRPGRFRARIG